MSYCLEDSGLFGWKVAVVEATNPHELQEKISIWLERYAPSFDETISTAIPSPDGKMTVEIRFRKIPILFA